MSYGFYFISLAVAIAGLVGSALIAMTRADAFDAADRMSKWIWCAMLAVAALAIVTGMMFLSWVGMVIIGLYWFDVRPQIKDILDYSNDGW